MTLKNDLSATDRSLLSAVCRQPHSPRGPGGGVSPGTEAVEASREVCL